MKKHLKGMMICTLLAVATTLIGCAAVSFTHANGGKGQSLTNAEVQPNNTVVMTYPSGSACIDTNPGESTTCAGQGK
ncbi:hypothetical protein [Serratia ureilytica]|uniref:Lipoprotein n=1 Tax=Serratia ureilytica TaxID=300181 RepID=A0A9X9G1K2_9GAMM|nr:hypothetical protein [Serratia ureilytica]TXE26925.1 hypothetical protein FOT63_18500 [Serratia ureilytica]